MAGKLRYFQERNGRFYARVPVASALREIIGKTELRAQLGPDRREAIRRHPVKLANLMSLIADAERKLALKTGVPNSLPRFQMTDEEIVRLNYRQRLDQDMEARTDSETSWYAKIGIDDGFTQQLRLGIAGAATDEELDDLVGHRIARFRDLGHTGAVRGTPGWRALAMKLCISEYEALERFLERDEGHMDSETSHPLLTQVLEVEERSQPVSMSDLLQAFLDHLRSLRRSESTLRKWKGVYDEFREFFAHDDASRVTRSDVRAWRDKLLETRGARTVKTSYLSAVRAAFAWAVEEDKLRENPAKDVRQAVATTPTGRPKSYSDDEAQVIIRFSRTYMPRKDDRGVVREAPEMTQAKLWVPLLCAQSGGRVSELTQLRKKDFLFDQGVHFLRITPDAGGNKGHVFRDVPIHQQLVEEGLMDVVGAAADGPLFYESPDPDGDYSKAQRQANRIATWLREAGLVPEGVQPSHAWRHRFKTVGRRHGQSDVVLNAICGHSLKAEGDRYGESDLVTKKQAIDQIPFIRY